MVALIILTSVFAAVFSYYLWTYLSSPLKSFPSAHWSTSFSNLWRLISVWGRNAQWTHIRLHEKYGSAVRMGPNIVSVSDPNALKEVFRSRNPWKKVNTRYATLTNPSKCDHRLHSTA